MQTADKYFKFIKEHPKLFDGAHDIFMPQELVDASLSHLNYSNRSVLVLFNIEFVVSLLYTYNVPASAITFYADHINKIKIAQKLNVNVVTDLKTLNMKFDFVVLNPPFGKFKEFKALSESLAKEKALIISGSRDYHNNEKAFENVEYYKYLGDCFPTAKITASLAIVNPKGAQQLVIVDGSGAVHTVAPNPEVTPGDDIGVWSFATGVLSKKLAGYIDVEKGQIDRKSSIINPSGIPVIFSAGKNGEDFTIENQATSTQTLIKDNTKFCWAMIDPSQVNLIGGLGLHKVVVTHAANEPGHLGNPKYAGPGWGCGTNCWFIKCNSKKDADECIRYLTHPDVVKLVKGLKSSVTSNSKAVWKKIPHHSHAKKWIPNYV
jgi:hypothetical protein